MPAPVLAPASPTSPTSRRSLVRRALASPLVDRLAAPHGIDRYLELVDPRLVVHAVRAEVVRAERRARGTVTLTLRPSDAWAGFQPGQHVVVGVPIDGVVHNRCFSLAGSPHRADGLLELTVKANPTGRVSRFLVDRARPGLVLHLSQAAGDFVLPPAGQRYRHLVLVSGGSGITPVLAMLRTLVDEGHGGPVTFAHYAQGAADLAYAHELVELVAALPQGRLLLGLEDDPARSDLVGRFGPAHVERLAGPHPLAISEVFLCGPAPFMAAVTDAFGRLGLADHVHLERFGLPPADPSLDAGEGIVAFERSGITVAAHGTLLETAEAAGLAPAFGCRRGICGTCTTTRRRGVVRDLVTGVTSSPDPGPVRPCTSVACGEVAVDL